MPKKKNETYSEYKKRILDTKNSAFCGAKWFNATIWLGSGTTASCHHPPAHKITLDDIKNNPSGLHNTRHKKLMRKLMQEGERPHECNYCWRIEDMNTNAVSDRVFKTVIYEDSDLQKVYGGEWRDNIPLKTLEIAFDRYCNFACSYCNASFSTTWYNDIATNGAYQNLCSDGASAFQQDGSWAEPYGRNESNPYVDAFWKWWPELSETLDELRVTGGEPLMSPDFWKLLSVLENEPEETKKRLRFASNTNLGIKKDLLNKLICHAKKIDNFDIYTSNESVNEQAEYIRDGLNYNEWKNNVETCLESGAFRHIHVMMTINFLSLWGITDLLDQMLEWKAKYGRNSPAWSVNILRFPSFMSPTTLPDGLREARQTVLQNWLSKNGNNKLLHEFEIDGLKRLIDYLDCVKTPHDNSSDLKKRWLDVKSFYKQYDQRRKKDLLSTFPDLKEWIEQIPEYTMPKKELVDGDATNIWKNDEKLKEIQERHQWQIKTTD